eukprot:CAMPEP_0117467628 /NCGR_PEP_ID=MMETSP0784-20121206/5754_1 /TAXON_ID=39447 /ORGANISM="" /LENGTH=112 /DNA_ID=CAMNT_0005261603 /DNA_START=656 /DNA_END=994 /DNA_ORIENTATION=+
MRHAQLGIAIVPDVTICMVFVREQEDICSAAEVPGVDYGKRNPAPVLADYEVVLVDLRALTPSDEPTCGGHDGARSCLLHDRTRDLGTRNQFVAHFPNHGLVLSILRGPVVS